jgi:3-hydroxybutyryl-CoA dehydrogenase
MVKKHHINHIGLAGLGLMGQGIATSFIASGFQLTAYSRTTSREEETKKHIGKSLEKLIQKGFVNPSDVADWEKRFKYVPEVEALKDCEFIVETVGESLELKKKIYEALESSIGPEVVIASNTSGISISLLQDQLEGKERFIGMHWAEPAEITRYLEIAPGENTNIQSLETAKIIGERCGKEPTVLNFEISGLISNRLMYAMMREAIHIVEAGVADIETVDRSFRNDIGWWAALCGPFRWMDLTGLKTYAKVMDGLFPELANTSKLPELMKKKVESGSLFYNYSEHTLKDWEEAWTDFSYDIREISTKYNEVDLSKSESPNKFN